MTGLGAKGANMVLAQTKRCSSGLHKHNPGHVCGRETSVMTSA